MLRSTLKIFFLLASFSFLAACGGGDEGPDCTDTAAQDRGLQVLEDSCQGCHESSVTGAARNGAPVNVTFDDEADIDMHDDRIRVRAVEMKTMPPAAPLGSGALPAAQISDLEAFLDCR